MKKTKRFNASNNNQFIKDYIERKIAEKDFYFTTNPKSGKVDTYMISEYEMKSFKPLYTSDRTDKYFSVKKDMPENYYVSMLGTVIYRSKKNFFIKKASIKGKREYYDLSIHSRNKTFCISFQPAALVNLAFDGKITDNAKVLIDNYGVMALRKLRKKDIDKFLSRKFYPQASDEARLLVRRYLETPKDIYHLVQLNHEIEYVYGNSTKEIMANKARNCDVRYSQFEYAEEHAALTYAPPQNASKEEIRNYMIRLVSTIPSKYPYTVIQKGKHGGTIERVTVTKNGELEIGNKRYKPKLICDHLFCHRVVLSTEDGKEIIKGVDMSPLYYEELVRKYKTFTESYGAIIKVRIGDYNGTDIYAGPKELDQTC